MSIMVKANFDRDEIVAAFRQLIDRGFNGPFEMVIDKETSMRSGFRHGDEIQTVDPETGKRFIVRFTVMSRPEMDQLDSTLFQPDNAG